MKKNLLLLFTTVIIIFFLGEVGARLWSHFVNPVSKVPDRIRYTYFPYLPYSSAPGYEDTSKCVYINKRGFRNSYEFLSPKPQNVYRIVCMGGSTTYSDFDNANNEEIWTGRLEYYLNLNSTDYKFEVINASEHNYTTYLNLIDYLTRVRDLEIDMVIIYEGVNDLYFNGFDTVSFAHANIFKHSDLDYVNQICYEMNNSFFLQNSEFLKQIYSILFLSDLNLNSLTTKAVHFYTEQNIDNMRKDSLLTFSKGLTGFIGLSKVDNFKLIFLSQAYQYQKKQEFIKYWNKSISVQSINNYIRETDRIKSRMEEVALQNNIPFLDMNKIFSQQSEYFCDNPYDGLHFSKRGDEFFALSLYNFLKSYVP